MKHRTLIILLGILGSFVFVFSSKVWAACGACTNGHCVGCSYTNYYYCGLYPNPVESQTCSYQENTTCCSNGYLHNL